MNTRPRRTTHRPRHNTAPALVSTVAGMWGRPRRTCWRSPGAQVRSWDRSAPVYGGLDLEVLAAFGGGRLAWCADTDPHVAEILGVRLPGGANLLPRRTTERTTFRARSRPAVHCGQRRRLALFTRPRSVPACSARRRDRYPGVGHGVGSDARKVLSVTALDHCDAQSVDTPAPIRIDGRSATAGPAIERGQ